MFTVFDFWCAFERLDGYTADRQLIVIHGLDDFIALMLSCRTLHTEIMDLFFQKSRTRMGLFRHREKFSPLLFKKDVQYHVVDLRAEVGAMTTPSKHRPLTTPLIEANLHCGQWDIACVFPPVLPQPRYIDRGVFGAKKVYNAPTKGIRVWVDLATLNDRTKACDEEFEKEKERKNRLEPRYKRHIPDGLDTTLWFEEKEWVCMMKFFDRIVGRDRFHAKCTMDENGILAYWENGRTISVNFSRVELEFDCG